MPICEKLLSAYRNTEYRCEDHDFVMRVGQVSNEAIELMSFAKAHTLTVITAANPQSELLDAPDNHAWNQRLRLQLEGFRKPFWECVNVAIDGEWPDEESFLVADLAPFDRDNLCEQYQQNAVLEIGRDGVPKIVDCTPLEEE